MISGATAAYSCYFCGFNYYFPGTEMPVVLAMRKCLFNIYNYFN